MSALPSVVAVCLVDGRREMVKRAWRCFEEQTYENSQILIWNSGPDRLSIPDGPAQRRLIHVRAEKRATIGELRNAANAYCQADIVVHWDSDDWSHPKRIEEQVKLLQKTGRQCVGYRDMIFWDERGGGSWYYENRARGYCLGTSLCYWRHVWQMRPFEALPTGPQSAAEDYMWLKGVMTANTSILAESEDDQPRMIAGIHEGNTSGAVALAMKAGQELRQSPEYDSFCMLRMAL